jgi:DNA-binding transcriptional LysR family regulator
MSTHHLLKLAVSFGTMSQHLKALLALQRAEEPDTPVLLQEAPMADAIQGMEDGLYDLSLTLAAAGKLSDKLLWQDELAVAVPEGSPLLAYDAIPLEVLAQQPIIRWCAHTCAPLSQQVDALVPNQTNVPGSNATSFEWMALLVASGYGVGVAPRARILRAREGGIMMRPLADGPYRVGVQLHQPTQRAVPAVERFVKRAEKIAAQSTTNFSG